jgi:hypothetical protein
MRGTSPRVFRHWTLEKKLHNYLGKPPSPTAFTARKYRALKVYIVGYYTLLWFSGGLKSSNADYKCKSMDKKKAEVVIQLLGEIRIGPHSSAGVVVVVQMISPTERLALSLRRIRDLDLDASCCIPYTLDLVS